MYSNARLLIVTEIKISRIKIEFFLLNFIGEINVKNNARSIIILYF